MDSELIRISRENALITARKQSGYCRETLLPHGILRERF